MANGAIVERAVTFDKGVVIAVVDSDGGLYGSASAGVPGCVPLLSVGLYFPLVKDLIQS